MLFNGGYFFSTLKNTVIKVKCEGISIFLEKTQK